MGGRAGTTADPEEIQLHLWADLRHLEALGEATGWELDQVAYGPELILSVGMRLMMHSIGQA